MAGQRDLPEAGISRETRSHGMNRESDRSKSPCLAFLDQRFNRPMVRHKPPFDSQLLRRLTKPPVARDRCAIAHFGNQVAGVELTITVDHQPGRTAEYGRSVEDTGQLGGDSGSPNI